MCQSIKYRSLLILKQNMHIFSYVFIVYRRCIHTIKRVLEVADALAY